MSIIVDDDLLSGGPFDLSKAPDKLYKYLPIEEKTIEAFEREEAWFASPKDWLDKSDFSFSFDAEGSLTSIREKGGTIILGLFRDQFKLLYENDRFAQIMTKMPADEVNRSLKNIISEDGSYNKAALRELCIEKTDPYWGERIFTKVTKKVDQAIIALTQGQDPLIGFFEKMNSFREKYCFLCLSEDFTTQSMWDNYVKKSGFVIGYTVDKDQYAKKNGPRALGRIFYGEKPAFNLGDFLAGYGHSALSNKSEPFVNSSGKKQAKAFFTKKPCYQYEKEWRVMVKGEESHLEPFGPAFAIFFDSSLDGNRKQRLLSIAKQQRLEVYERRFDCVHNDYYFAQVNQ